MLTDREKEDNIMSCGCENTMKNNTMGRVACSPSVSLGNNNNIDICCNDESQIIINGVCSQEKLEGMLTSTDLNWTQLFIPEILCVPCQKPDIEELMSVTARVEIISQRVVKTPMATTGVSITNQEDTNLTGKKLVIEGVLKQKVIYTADLAEQSVHSAHFDVPFSAFIIVPQDTSVRDKFLIEPCIEDIYISSCNKRQIFKNVTLFIKATPLLCS
jgi:hypothetical protein